MPFTYQLDTVYTDDPNTLMYASRCWRCGNFVSEQTSLKSEALDLVIAHLVAEHNMNEAVLRERLP